MGCTDCTNLQPFPTETKQFSITNYVEIIKIDQICNTNRNRFEMIRYVVGKTIKQSVITFGIKQSEYNAYLVTEMLEDRFKIISKNFSDNIIRKGTYFFVNKTISKPIEYLGTKLFDLWRTRSGNRGTSTIHFPIPIERYPLIMPSRTKYHGVQ